MNRDIKPAVTAVARLGSFEGSRLLQLQRHYKLSFHERLKLHESMGKFVKTVQQASWSKPG